MTRGGVMDMSSFSLSFKSSQNDSISENLSTILDKMSTTGRRLLSELESAKEEAGGGQSSRLAQSLPLSDQSPVEKSTQEQGNLQARCEKLEDVVLFLLQENASLSRFQREANKLCAKCKNLIEESQRNKLKNPKSQIHVCSGCSKHMKLVMEKAAELRLENDQHILRICKLEEVINTREERQEKDGAYKQRIEELHKQLLVKETEIENLKDALKKDSAQQDMMTSVVHSKDICNRKEVLQLCEKYERLKKVSKKQESDLTKLCQSKMKSMAKIQDLERQLHQSLKREESNKRQLEERQALEKMQTFKQELLTMSLHAHRVNMTEYTHEQESSNHSASDQIIRPKSILKKACHKREIPPTSFAIGKQNPIIINEKRSSTVTDSRYQPPYEYSKAILDVGKKEDTSYSSSSLDSSSTSDSLPRSHNSLNEGDRPEFLMKDDSFKDHFDVEITSPSSGTSEHIGRYEFLQERRILHAKGKTCSDVDMALSARQQEYADKLIKKYTKGLTLSGQSY